ncbi:Uncharacterized protein HZ326_2981 [Fusarium oxysporum f. sp. albedinis]|nr:Uncharacterized protein HZ326_2981 [Fusarium oxysporum f. sp. albedinis]
MSIIDLLYDTLHKHPCRCLASDRNNFEVGNVSSVELSLISLLFLLLSDAMSVYPSNLGVSVSECKPPRSPNSPNKAVNYCRMMSFYFKFLPQACWHISLCCSVKHY